MRAMKALVIVALVVVAAWLGMWVTSTGVLVSSSDTGVLKTRDCRYLVGVTVQKRLEPLAERCPFVRHVGR
jgi:hypothetical protein